MKLSCKKQKCDMVSKRTVKWSKKAEITFNENLIYLKENWTVNEMRILTQKVDQVIVEIKKNTSMYEPWEHDKKIRKAFINKHITMYYEIFTDSIYIHVFWNKHQNPENLGI